MSTGSLGFSQQTTFRTQNVSDQGSLDYSTSFIGTSSTDGLDAPIPGTPTLTPDSLPSKQEQREASSPDSLPDRVTIACTICRKRKTRCDGRKPRCGNCQRRDEVCEFGSVAKRRGPDKLPGTRVRTVYSKKLLIQRGIPLPPGPGRKKKDPDFEMAAKKVGIKAKVKKAKEGSKSTVRASEESSSAPTTHSPETPVLIPGEASSSSDVKTEVEQLLPTEFDAMVFLDSSVPEIYALLGDQVHAGGYVDDTFNPQVQDPTAAFITELEEDDEYDSDIVPPPSIDFNRRTWWDALLDSYTPDRLTSVQHIRNDIAFLFALSPYFLSFIHVPRFWQTFHHPPSRDAMQPSLIFGTLAFAVFMRSPEGEGGPAGRMRALRLAEIARAHLQTSLNAGWVDPQLAQAAFVLTLFEMCPHPDYSYSRLTSSYWVLDSIMASLSLTSLDAYDPHAVVFAPSFVPSVSAQHSSPRAKACSCATLALPAVDDRAMKLTPFWSQTPAWDPEWTETEIRMEECRRLCWNTLNIESGHTSVALEFGLPMVDFHCTRPENYALLFPGETLSRSSKYTFVHHPRDSVWSVYARLALLFGACWRYKKDPKPTAGERAQFAYRAWLETLELEEILNSHVCFGEQSTLFQGREFLFKIRVLISRGYRNYFPFPESGIDLTFHRRKAEQWLSHQAVLARHLMQGLKALDGLKSMSGNDIYDLKKRPFLLWYFALQSQRCIMFYDIDMDLKIALEGASAWLMPVQYILQYWPCRPLQTFVDQIKVRIDVSGAQATIE